MRTCPQSSRFRLLFGALTAIALVGGCGGSTTTPEDQSPTLTFTLSPTSATVDQGGSVAVSGTATVGGSFTGDVTVSLEGWPIGLTGVVSGLQSNGTTTTVTVTLSVALTLPAGTYPLTIRASGSGINQDATFTLTVNEVNSIALEVSPDTITLEQSTAGTRDVDLTRVNFTGPVVLAAEGVPADMAVTFAPNPVAQNQSTATVTVGSSVPVGSYEIVVRGTASVPDAVDTLTVTVVATTGPNFLLSVDPDTVRFNAGGQGMTTVDITRVNGHTAAINMGLIPGLDGNNNPLGVGSSFVPDPATGATSDLTLTTPPTILPGTYTVTVTGDDGVLLPRVTPLVLVIGAVPSYEIDLDTDTLTLDQGDNGDVAVTLTRANFAENVDLTIEGLPAGATGTFNPASTTGDASTLTVSVGGSVAVGDYTITVRGTSSLPDETETFVLRVTEPVGFTLSSIPDVTIAQGGSGSRDVTINRTGGFSGDVTITVEGLPAGITATVTPMTTGGSTATISVDVDPGVPVQTYLPTIRGTATGQPDALTSMDINVVAPAGTPVSMDFSVCSAGDRPVWLAYQDGGGAWTPVTGVADVYDFTISSGTAGVTYVVEPFGGESTIFTQYLSQSELGNGEYVSFCNSAQGSKTINGTVANTVGQTKLNLGGAFTTVFADGAFQIFGVGDGALDFVGYSAALAGADRMVILRDQDIAHNGSIGTVDFTTSGFDASSATITVGGLSGGESLAGGMNYATVSSGNACQVAQLTFGGLANPFTGVGAPGGQQAGDDYHVANIIATSGTTSLIVQEAFQTLANRTVDVGAPLSTPTVTDVTGSANYLRLQADYTLPNEYDTFSSFTYTDGASKTVSIFASNAAQSGSVSFTLPDFTGLAGWTDTWGMATSATNVSWGATGSGQSAALPLCTEGGRSISASEAGIFN